MLVAHIDRLVTNTQAIRVSAQTSSLPTHFTRAVLDTPLGDLIRDIEPAELGLFTPQLARVEFHGPAPRRKQDPEVYAQAAFTYIDRYHAIRPMPRAHTQVVGILEQLAAARKSIRVLTDTLNQVQPSEIKPLADQEELRVQQLQAKLEDLKKRRDVLAASAAQSKPRKRLLRPKPEPPSTPVPAGRTLRFTDKLLMDEHLDVADISVTSPLPPTRIQERASFMEEPERSVDEHGNVAGEREGLAANAETSFLTKSSTTPPLSPVLPAAVETPKKGKLRVNTEVERIVAKIWASAGDLIMPGHLFDTSGMGTGNKPLRAKETITHLRMIAALTPTPASPSTTVSSLAGTPAQPTSQQILTAHLLVSLLMATPHFSMPLNKVKEALAAKASANGSSGIILGGQSTTRVLFGCVGKRLLKIEWGGGEQIVKFDV
ncbi:hypothetical protein B0H10DRAFT_2070406 [Mycena sp. CBHHK59/15]|nr:hypothetical protein B0H10DRAFT_2070406 [Mycena sp. CBHHK59/15]